ncbi:hypothetical protein G5B30_12150 [Sphingobacterium sp. SGG-5]|uniref:hypothetical protein n=1 Tax=Sphingobacterium sp. SGG-5 TaxID=2710881 RepID=UPI0013EB4C4C|nr:hypothetical protein [Sphingobacterium sp. SGG-5]NGM62668.1 hypothetical protein [Sphingobacterium sp. SGG-5]
MRPLTNVQVGTLGGTFCSLWNSFDWSNLFQTAVMAAVGATVSYLLSRLLEGKRRGR